jgi:hypothetical protein
LLWLAYATDAWTPEGPLRPSWLRAEQEWRPGYVCSDDPALRASDCHVLANALELASSQIPRTRDEAALIPAVQIPRVLAGGFLDAPYLCQPFAMVRTDKALRDRIPELVALLRLVPLDGGELVVFSEGLRSVDAV